MTTRIAEYYDPEDTELRDSIISLLRNTRTLGEVKEIVDERYPGLISGFINKYSDDYKILEENWTKFCIFGEIEKKQIMLLRHGTFDENSKIVGTIAEIFSRAGFLVRRVYDIVPCDVCGKALISEQAYNVLREKAGPRSTIKFPEIWSSKCSTCGDSS